jgi:hypothetical protein
VCGSSGAQVGQQGDAAPALLHWDVQSLILLQTESSKTSLALDKAGFSIVASGLKQCLAEDGGELDLAEMEKLFLSLA